MTQTLTQVLYLVASALFLFGLRGLTSPATARRGVFLAELGMLLAITFGIYGLLRKQVAVGSLPGLTIESAILLLPSVGIAGWYALSPAGSSFDDSLELSLSIVLGGVLTAVPLLLFAIAARRMDYSTLGFIQFLAPTIVCVLGLTVFDKPLQQAEIFSFVLIWIALAIFVWDLLAMRRATRPVAS